MIGRNRVRHILQQHGLAGTRRRNDQPALSFAERCEQVHDARADVLARVVSSFRRSWGYSGVRLSNRSCYAASSGDSKLTASILHQREILLALMRRTHLAADGVSRFQVELRICDGDT